MTREEAELIISDCVFNGEYAADEKQTEAYFTLFKSEVNHPECLHKITHETVLINGFEWVDLMQNADGPVSAYYKEIVLCQVYLNVYRFFGNEDYTLHIVNEGNSQAITASVTYWEDIELLMEYIGVETFKCIKQ